MRKSGTPFFQDITADMVLPLSIRCIIGNIGFLAVTYTYKYLPLSVGTVIIASSPFAVSILCALFLKERVYRSDLIAIFVHLSGRTVVYMLISGMAFDLSDGNGLRVLLPRSPST